MTFDGRPAIDPWISLAHEGTAGTLRYQVLDGLVHVEGSVTIAMANGATVVILAAGNALPPAVRPSLGLWLPALVNGGTLPARVARNDNGTISAAQATGSAATSIQFAYSYPIG